MNGTTHHHLSARDEIARADALALALRLEALAHDLSAAPPSAAALVASDALRAAADAARAIDPDAGAALQERVAAIAALSGVGAALLFGAAPTVRRNLADALHALAARLRGAPHGTPDAGAAANAAIDDAARSGAAGVAAAAILVAAGVKGAARR